MRVRNYGVGSVASNCAFLPMFALARYLLMVGLGILNSFLNRWSIDEIFRNLLGDPSSSGHFDFWRLLEE